MRGGKMDVLGGHIERAGFTDGPENRFVTRDNHLGFVDVCIGENHKEVLASQRTVPMMVITRSQGIHTRLQNQEEGIFGNGGLAIIPPAGIWKGVKSNA